MKILVIDIGGTNVKVKANNAEERRKIPSGDFMTPELLVEKVKESTVDWDYDCISIGFPSVVKNGQIVQEPVNIGKGWIGFDFEAAFGKPVRILNDAAMQALGSYQGGTLLFMGFGTGLGTAVIVDGKILPTELAHLPYKKGTYEEYVGVRGMEYMGQKKWQKHVLNIVDLFSKAIRPDDIVLGGGNSKYLTELPEECRLGNNKLAFEGGLRMWEMPEFKNG